MRRDKVEYLYRRDNTDGVWYPVRILSCSGGVAKVETMLGFIVYVNLSSLHKINEIDERDKIVKRV